MTSKIKKSSSNMSFSLSRWFRRISTNAPSAFIVTAVGISYAIFLFGGGLYTLINQPLTSFYNSNTGQFFFLYPDISSQFVSDTLISITLYALGFMGLLAIYQSSKSAYKPRQAYMLLIIGVALLLLAYVFLEGSIQFKATGGQ
jgi:hypothetical protein